jgi:hypothetical protein
MNDYKYSSQILIKTQQISWYISLIYFAVVTFAYLIEWQIAETLAVIGVIFIIAVTILKLFIMGQHFNKLKLRRFSLLSYFLVIVLIATVIWRFLR